MIEAIIICYVFLVLFGGFIGWLLTNPAAACLILLAFIAAVCIGE